jgi:hypothetical protein
MLHPFRVTSFYVGITFIIVMVDFLKMKTFRFNIVCKLSSYLQRNKEILPSQHLLIATSE